MITPFDRPHTASCLAAVLTAALLAFAWTPAGAQQIQGPLQRPQNHIRPEVATGQAPLVGALPVNQRLNFSIVLPLRNPAQLNSLLARLYDPASPDYRHFLTVDQFTDRFGPSAQDYQAVVAFAQAHGFTVTATPANRLVVSLSGTVAQVESALNVRMNFYQHPTENRTFFSPDRDPSLAISVPIAAVTGLTNFSLPHPMVIPPSPDRPQVANVTGSGPGGWYLASDMRAAYYGETTLDGTGQAVGLLEFDGYYASDVTQTFTSAGQTYNVPINNVLLDGATGSPTSEGGEAEVVLDIVQAIGMAPGLSQVRVYIGNYEEGLDDANILNSIATENIAKQISSSWAWQPDDPSTDDTFFEEMAAQGQSFFVASGDSGAYDSSISPYFYPSEDDYVTAVGGTSLVTASAGGAWTSETAWNDSGGGVSPDAIAIPSWQNGLANSSNGGSVTLRNIPDVAMEADFDNYICSFGACEGGWAGTSFAAPRWAGFMAMVNQQAVENGNAPTGGLGFLNPPLYAIGAGTDYDNDLHDISSGNNDDYNQPVWYSAVAGYDLVTGWGSANGANLINDLAGPQVPGFWMHASAPNLGIAPGSSGTTTISITDAGGFTGNVSLVVPTLPTGVTASWGTNPSAGSSVLTLTAASDAPTSNSNLTITGTATGTSGELTSSTTIALTVHPPTFLLSSTPPALSIYENATTSSTLLVTPEYGFTGSVSLSITGLPSGVTASLSPTSTSGTSMLTLTAGSSVTAGTTTLTVTGTSGNLTVITSIALTVEGPSFTFYPPTNVAIGQGASASTSFSVDPEFGFSGNVSLSISGLPSGVTASFSPNPVTITQYGATCVLTLTAASSTPLGTSTVTITGTSGNLTETTTFSLGVYTPTFALSANGPLNVGQGASATTNVTVFPEYGFNGNVTLSVTGLPTGVTALWSPNPTTYQSQLVLSVANSVPAGNTTLTITGASGSVTATTKLTLAVQGPTFTVSGGGSINMGQGTSATSYLYLYPQYGFSGNVSLSVTGLPSGVTATLSPNPVALSSGTYEVSSILTLTASSSAAVGNSTLTITATSGNITQTATLYLSVYAPTFTLYSNGANVGQGTSVTTYVDINDQWGFNGAVNLSVSGLPAGVTGSFSPNPTTGYSTLTLTASASAPLATSTATITGTSGNITQTTTITVAVYQPNFSLSGYGGVSIGQGTSGTSYLYLYSNYGFAGNVSFSVSGLPSGVTASFSPNPAPLASNGSTSDTLTLTASSSAPTGQYNLTVTATSGTLTQTTPLTLGVYSSSFTLSGGSADLGQSSSTTSYVYVYSQYGFAGNVNLSISGVPNGVTVTFAQNPVTVANGSSAYSQVTITTTNSAAPGSYNLTLTGTSGNLTASTTFPLTIYPPSFTLYSGFYNTSLNAGSSTTGTVYIYPSWGFSGAVTLSASGLPSGVTASFSPNPSTGSTSAVTLSAAANATPVTVTVTINGVSGSQTASTTFNLTINPQGFSIAAGPAQVNLVPGSSADADVAVIPQNGFAGSVTLTATGLPNGVTASFSLNPVSAGDSVLTLAAGNSAASGSATVTITATSGSLTASTTLTVDIQTAATATSTTLQISAAGNPVQTVPAGTVVTLTAAAAVGSVALTAGQIDFCDATAPLCDSIRRIGSAHLTSAGAAVLRFTPGMGSRSYKAVFLGTNGIAGSASSAVPLTVTASQPTVTTIAQSGSPGPYTLTATLTGTGVVAPAGTVSFLDVSNGNTPLTTTSLGKGSVTLGWTNTLPSANGSTPQAIAVADFNGDGIPDLAVANYAYNGGTSIVTILLGKGDGTFTAVAATPQLGTNPEAIVVGDFNGDGKPDLAALNQGSNTVTILLGNGDGTFNPAPMTPGTAQYPSSIVAGDFNGDGVEDLAILDNYGALNVLLGNGDGTFTPSPLSPAINASSLAVGDFNGDGILDLATCTSTSPGVVTLLLGNGDGSFTVIPGPTVGNNPSQVATADFNHDGKLDLVVLNGGDETASILLGNGDGTFTAAPPSLPSTLYPTTLAVGDFNGDGVEDLAFISSQGQVLIFTGNGDGSFTPATSVPTTNAYLTLVAADFNGDGAQDLAIGAYDGNITVYTAQVMQTNTVTTTGVPAPVSGDESVDAGYSGDTNYKSSLSSTTVLGKYANPTVTVTPSLTSITIRETLPVTITVSGGNGNPIPTGTVVLSSNSYTSSSATLTSGSASITIPAGSLYVGNDTLTATYTPDSASFSTYNGATGTEPVTVLNSTLPCASPNPNPNPNPESFAAVADFNGDCKSDILWRNTGNQEVYEWFMNGTIYTGGGSPGSPGNPTSDWVIQGAGDFNGDGMADILWRNSTTGEVYIWLMNGSTLTGSGSLGFVSSGWSIAGIGDFNGDGKADILWWNSTTEQVYIWFIYGTSMFGGGAVSNVAAGWNIAGIGDFNGDGKADILWRNSSTGQTYVWLMHGTTIASSGSPGTATADWVIQGVGDFDGNGTSDILWRNSTTGQVYLWFIDGTTTTSGASVSSASSDWVIQGVGDYDGSGRAGILWRNTATEQVYIWLMNGATITGQGSPGTPAAVWQIAP